MCIERALQNLHARMHALRNLDCPVRAPAIENQNFLCPRERTQSASNIRLLVVT